MVGVQTKFNYAWVCSPLPDGTTALPAESALH